ncbi:MAG: RluA family pseudouridine synthase [Muribaculaceae bacterium]|nr:RluA family pseudouridine synthase [Muribaculaceae bacterium]
MNNPFEYAPDAACDAAFRELVGRIDTLKLSSKPEEINFCRELEAGKMLGVLIVKDESGEQHVLYAFSGQVGEGGFYHEGFVDPVFDYLRPDDYFKTREAYISQQNKEIDIYEKSILAKINADYDQAKARLDAEVDRYREKCRLSKLGRKAKKESGLADEAEMADMIRQSQFEKAELHRLKRRVASDLAPLATRLKEAQSRIDAMKEKRRGDSEALQNWLFANFKLLNARGESRSLSEIFADTPMKTPPSGAGECCAPKLLQSAYLRGWKPISIAEYWYGNPKGGEARVHGQYYPACRGKCLPVLSWMLQGLDIEPPLNNYACRTAEHHPKIIYENQWFCVVDKPSGMLSVPGKVQAISLQEWLSDKYPDRDVKMAHRLDQDTSGLIVATFGPVSFKVMQSLFAMRKAKKAYVADLAGDYGAMDISRQGRIELPLSPDWHDRPRQRIDFASGKIAVTEYEFKSVSAGCSRVIFCPFTGRTHQLRVHAASEQGLGMPIIGDRLYGKNGGDGSKRLHLHAHKLEFTFPIDHRHYSFESPVPF